MKSSLPLDISLSLRGAGRVTELERSCAKYLLCLLLLQVSGMDLVLRKYQGEEESVFCFSRHVPSSGMALSAAQRDLPAGLSYSSRCSPSVQGAGPPAKSH